MNILACLIKLASTLDKKGFYKDADAIDNLILRLAMTREQAMSLLGVSQFDTPDMINKAFKHKALEFHPDINPKNKESEEMMKNLNIARDILMGERREDSPFNPPPPRYNPEPPRWEPPPKSKPERISFKEAAEVTGIPMDVKWLFKTDTSYSPPLGDTKMKGFVVCGKTKENCIFAACFYLEVKNAFNGADSEEWEIGVRQYSLDTDLSREAPSILREMMSEMGRGQARTYLKGYNNKVQILPPGTAFDESLSYMRGNSVSLQDALIALGEMPATERKGKIDIELAISSTGKLRPEYSITLIVNGRPFDLGEELSIMLCTQSNLLKVVFGTYYYASSKKNITKMREKSRILGYLVNKLEGRVVPELMGALKAAFEQSGPEKGSDVPPASKAPPTSEQLRAEIERLKEENERLRKMRK